MQQVECLSARSKILNFEKNNNIFLGLAIETGNVKILSPEGCETIQNLRFDLLNKQTTAIAFHPTLGIMAIANETILYIINLKKKEITQTIATHDGIITKLLFVEKSPYLISGTGNGRVIQYRYDGKSHISRLCSFPYTNHGRRKKIDNNYVSAIAYNEEYIACSGYGGAVTLIKFNSHARKITFEISKTQVNSITFVNSNKIIFANSEGTIFITEIKTNNYPKQIYTSHKNIQEILLLPENKFALITSADNNNIMLLDIQNCKIIEYKFLQFEQPVHNLILHNNVLFCIQEDNTLQKIVLTTPTDIIHNIRKGELVKAMAILESNPMLRGSQAAKELHKIYQTLYRNSFLEFIRTDKTASLDKLKEFSTIKSKKDDIEGIRKAYVNYEKMQLFFKEHKYALAYALVEKFPALQHTIEYQKMEEYYKRSFTLAQKQLLLQRPQTAKELLEPFSTIRSKRPMIQLLLKQNKEFLEFLRAINKKNYASITNLLSTTPIFKEIPLYITLIEDIHKDLKEIKHLIYNTEIDKALQKLQKLQNISMIKDELLQLHKFTIEAKQLLDYYNKENFIQCYEMLDKNLELEKLQLSHFLEKHWKKLMIQCEVYALQGDIQGIKKRLGNLIYVKTRKNKIGDLLRISFHSRIKADLNKLHYKSAENLIYSYIDIFNIDSEIQYLMKNFEKLSHTKLAITLYQKREKERNGWLYSALFKESNDL